MKNLVLIIVTIFLSIKTYSQVGINTTVPKAQLDIAATNQALPNNTDGILIPRIDTFPITNPSADQNSMLVYLTTTDGTDAPGFYYWNNATTSWLPFGGATSGWELTGNSGTTSGTNFLGTTDAQDLDIRTNNVIKHRFTQQGQIEFINTGTSVFLGEGAGALDDLSTNRNILIGFEAGNDMTNSPNNTVIGWRAMDAATNSVDNNVGVGMNTFGNLTTGSSNVAIGVGSLSTTTTANNSIAIGLNALSNAVASENNVAIGRSAGANSDGPDNVYIGYQADSFNANAGATQNVIIGSGAGELTGGTIAYVGRVMLGYQAGRNSGTNNSLFLENSSSVTPLIYGEFDNDILRVGGQLQIGSSDDTTSGAIYSFPTVDGTSGQALTTDGSGNVSWSTLSGGGADTQDLSITDATGTISLVDGGSVNVSTIADADADTKIQVEETADEDIIRFDVAGNEKLTLNAKGQLEFLNTGSSILIGENSGNSDDLANRRNVLIGDAIAPNVSTGSVSIFDSAYNVGIGYQNLSSLTRGASNVAIGRRTLNRVTTQSDNIAIGRQVLEDFESDRSVFIGAYSGLQRTSGAQNTFLGYNSNGFGVSTGGNNTGIGANVLSRLTSGTTNTVVGPTAGARLTTGSFNTIIGENAGMASSASDGTVNGTVIIGNHAGENNTIDNLFMVHNRNTTNTSPKTLLSGIFANTTFNGLNTGPFSDNRVGINIDLGANAVNLTHTLTVGGTAKIEDVLNLKPGTEPTTPAEGDIYFDATTKKLRVYNGTAWDNLN